MRIVTGGTDDSKVMINSGPPFKRLASSDAHVKGAVYAVAYNHDGTVVASVGSDKSVCLYDGKTLELICRKEEVHDASIYACSWSSDGKRILTSSADGTVKLLNAELTLEVLHTWNVAEQLIGSSGDKVPIGGMQVGCAFVKDDVPASVCLNGDIVVLPKPGDGDSMQVFTGHNVPIAGLVVKGDWFYTADTNGVVVQWNTEDFKAIQRLKPPNDEQGLFKVHGDATISCLTVTSDGTLLTAGWDDTIRISNDEAVASNPITLEAQPNAMACGTNLVVVMTVGGLVLVKGKWYQQWITCLAHCILNPISHDNISTLFIPRSEFGVAYVPVGLCSSLCLYLQRRFYRLRRRRGL
jgi:WD40 repeat protein